MRVLLISANTESINMPIIPVGLGAVAAASIRAGAEVRWLDLMREPEPAEAIREAVSGFNPGVIGISVRNIDDQSMVNTRFLLEKARQLVSACRECSGAKIVVGGAGYSIFPSSALSYLGADMGIKGEGEAAFPALIDRLEQGLDPGNIPGLHLPGRPDGQEPEPVADLDSLPLPDPRLWAPYGSSPELWLPFQTRRGCPMDCSYCSTSAIEGRLIRKRSPKKVVETLAAYARAGFNKIFFTDNTFNLPPSYARELCRRMIEQRLQIHWRCIIYPKGIDKDLVRDMAEAGCREVSLGFESGAESVLLSLNKRFLPKEVRKIADLLAEHGIRRMGFLLLGGPGETRATVEQSLEFADSLGLDALRLTGGIRIYPDTALARLAVQQGVIPADDDLLAPRFYLMPELDGWLESTLKKWAATRPNWIL